MKGCWDGALLGLLVLRVGKSRGEAMDEGCWLMWGYMQVFFPLVQGTLWTLALSGWRFWNKGARVGGRSVGGRIRKWWWGVNNWEIPREKGGRLGDRELARQVGEVSSLNLRIFKWARL